MQIRTLGVNGCTSFLARLGCLWRASGEWPGRLPTAPKRQSRVSSSQGGVLHECLQRHFCMVHPHHPSASARAKLPTQVLGSYFGTRKVYLRMLQDSVRVASQVRAHPSFSSEVHASLGCTGSRGITLLSVEKFRSPLTSPAGGLGHSRIPWGPRVSDKSNKRSGVCFILSGLGASAGALVWLAMASVFGSVAQTAQRLVGHRP